MSVLSVYSGCGLSTRCWRGLQVPECLLSVCSGCGSSTRCWRGLQVPECLFCLYVLGVGRLQGVGEGCRGL